MGLTREIRFKEAKDERRTNDESVLWCCQWSDSICTGASALHVYNVIKYMAGLYALVVLLGCSLQSMGLYQGYVNKYNANAYLYEHFRALAQEIAEIVPENFKLVQEFIYYDIAFGYFVKEEELE